MSYRVQLYFSDCVSVHVLQLLLCRSPHKYGHRAMGELFVFVNIGTVMVTGTSYTLTGVFSMKALVLSIPVGLMVAGILHFQSLPEIEIDKASGKNTLKIP